MKIKDFTAFFASLDQEADVLMADYYYSAREGFVPATEPLSLFVARPAECPLWLPGLCVSDGLLWRCETMNIAIISASGLKSGERLAEALGVPSVRNGAVRDVAPGTTLLNWGVAEPARYCHNYNTARSIDKIATFDALQRAGISHVDWFVDPSLRPPGSTVICRTVLDGYDGAGIVIKEPGEALPSAPLYTIYKPNRHELRAHVVFGKVVYIHQKVRKEGSTADIRVRAGKDFVWNNSDPAVDDVGCATSADVSALAVSAIAAVGLDYGAVDMIYNRTENRLYVVEVNSAPELLGERLDAWAARIREVFGLGSAVVAQTAASVA